jgi:hypothetical protein
VCHKTWYCSENIPTSPSPFIRSCTHGHTHTHHTSRITHHASHHTTHITYHSSLFTSTHRTSHLTYHISHLTSLLTAHCSHTTSHITNSHIRTKHWSMHAMAEQKRHTNATSVLGHLCKQRRFDHRASGAFDATSLTPTSKRVMSARRQPRCVAV